MEKKNTINITTANNSIIAHKVVIQNSGKSKTPVHENSIASDLMKKNYIKHLIDRYNEFKKIEVGDALNYAGIYGSIKKEFKCSAFQIPLEKFDSLAFFLQSKVDKTKQGRINKGNGYKSYSTFEEYVAHIENK